MGLKVNWNDKHIQWPYDDTTYYDPAQRIRGASSMQEDFPQIRIMFYDVPLVRVWTIERIEAASSPAGKLRLWRHPWSCELPELWAASSTHLHSQKGYILLKTTLSQHTASLVSMSDKEATDEQPAATRSCVTWDVEDPIQKEITGILKSFQYDIMGIISLGRDGVMRSLTADRKVLSAVPFSMSISKVACANQHS